MHSSWRPTHTTNLYVTRWRSIKFDTDWVMTMISIAMLHQYLHWSRRIHTHFVVVIYIPERREGERERREKKWTPLTTFIKYCMCGMILSLGIRLYAQCVRIYATHSIYLNPSLTNRQQQQRQHKTHIIILICLRPSPQSAIFTVWSHLCCKYARESERAVKADCCCTLCIYSRPVYGVHGIL